MFKKNIMMLLMEETRLSNINILIAMKVEFIKGLFGKKKGQKL